MATADDGRARYESGGAEEKPRKRPFRPEINEEPQIVSQEAGRNNATGVSDEGGNSTSISAATGLSELQQMWKQKTITRSEIQHPMTMENVPADLLLNIFIRLLAKQLAQMRCISKSWNALLSQSSLVKSHLHYSINNNDRILMVFYNNISSSSNPKPFTAHPCRSPNLKLTNLIKLPSVKLKSRYSASIFKVIGSVHGLICSRYDDNVIHIWNPSLSVVSTLPPHSMPPRCNYEIYFRFGFDPKTEDYKVVKLIGLTGALPYLIKEWLQVEVYSMKRGSWELVSQRFPSHVTTLFNCDVVCVDGHDGHLHWLGYIDEEGKLETIVAFDLGSETFREIPFPDSVLDGKRSNALGALGGKLCVMSWYEEDDVCEVWVMYEYGVTESWAKHRVLSHLPDGLAYGFTSHNEFLIVDDDFHIVLYDPTARKAKILDKFCHGNDDVEIFLEYVDSLVWVAPAKRVMMGGAGQN